MDLIPPPRRLLEMNGVLLLSLPFRRLPFASSNGHDVVLRAPLVVRCGLSLQALPLLLSRKVFLVPSAITSDPVGSFQAKPARPLGDAGGHL